MAIYIFNIFLTFLLAHTANRQMISLEKKSNVGVVSKKRWLVFILLLWVLIYAFRGITGGDAFSYYRGYKAASLSSASVIRYVSGYRDKLFHFLDYFISKLSKGNWVAICAFWGFLTYFPVLIVIRKESVNVTVSALLYIFILSYYYGFNGVRQALSVSFCFMAYYLYFKEKKYVKYALCLLVAYGFHSATILVVVFHILSRLKFKSSLVRVGLITVALGSFFILLYWGKVIDILQIFGQKKMANNYAQIRSGNGSGILRALVALAPAALAIWKYPALRKKYKDIDCDLMMSLFGGIFMLYSMQTWYIAQIAEYFNIFNIILLPKALSSFEPETRSQYTLAIMILYFGYMIALLLHGDGSFYPYIPVWKMVV